MVPVYVFLKQQHSKFPTSTARICVCSLNKVKVIKIDMSCFLNPISKFYVSIGRSISLDTGFLKGSRISTRAIQDAFTKNLKKAGIHKKASVHTVRHAFATHLLENGASIFYIRQLLGHSTIWTTTRYLHVATTDILKTVSPLDTLLNDAKFRKEANNNKSDSREVPTNA